MKEIDNIFLNLQDANGIQNNGLHYSDNIQLQSAAIIL